MSLIDLLPSLTTGWISPGSLTELAGFAVRSTLLLTGGLAAAGLLRLTGCSAAIRFRVMWLSAAGVPLLLAGSLLTDSMASVAPLHLRFPEIPAWAKGAAGKYASAIVEPENPFDDQAPVAAGPAATRAEPLDWRTVPAGLWVAGMGLTFCGMAWRHWRMRRWTLRMTALTNGQKRIRGLLRETAAAVGLRFTPRLFFANDWTMPGMGGGRRPWLLLPSEAEDWEEGRLRHVLLHECGHIARGDARLEFQARLALTPLWFHPLSWVLRRRLSVLRELACDDWVLTRGRSEPAAYAADLLALVKRHAAEALIRHPGGSRPMPPGPLMGMAQPSSAGLRIRRLLQSDVRRNEPGRGLISALAASSVILTGFCLVLVSCEITGNSKPQPALLASSFGGVRQTVSKFPEEAKPGAAAIQFVLLEITSMPGQKNFLTPWLPLDGRLDPSAASLAFSSLRAPAQQRGVDLMALPGTTDGQELRCRYLRELRYPVSFDEAGTAKEYSTRETGVRFKIRGQKTPDGSAVLTDVEWSVEELTGELILPIPGGKTVRQPMFESRRGSRTKLLVPNGGFTILTDDDAPLTKSDEAFTQEQLAKLKETRKPNRRWLALGASSAPLPPAAAGVEAVRLRKQP